MIDDDKETLKTFILNYHNYCDDEVNEISSDDFFMLKDDVALYSSETTHTDDHIYMNELETLVDRVCTQREVILFLLLRSGRSVKDIARIFELTETRINQLINQLLDKIIENKEGLNGQINA
ncbi:helix-turn-helix domain containing protein [Staphylococcus devriesei]|uniref:helix-turn-helix domain containing protein n=1 Tax=Staphylococcus devriesei TaxID=586733 RepID=UPI000CD1FB51|nr:helix-turn-helix domain containing protein [Staphylococcus devriesei]PNZ86333.1 pathogenicity island family protein [Staphylococcus devriesei]SUM03151.1 transposase [Staphylococcus devriesei]